MKNTEVINTIPVINRSGWRTTAVAVVVGLVAVGTRVAVADQPPFEPPSTAESASDVPPVSPGGFEDTQVPPAATSPSGSAATKTESRDKSAAIRSQIVIIGADGRRQEYNIGDALPGELEALAAPFLSRPGLNEPDDLHGLNAEEPRYMIGVVCVPLDDTMRRHLKIPGRGLLVKGVSKEMPAAAAGILSGDILLSMNGDPLAEVGDLISIAERSEGKELSVTLLHEGDARDVRIVPRKLTLREAMKTMPPLEVTGVEGANPAMISGRSAFRIQRSGMQPRLIIQSFGPALELPEGLNSRMEKSLSELLSRAAGDGTESAKAAGSETPAVRELIEQLELLKKRVHQLEQGLSP